MLSHSTTQIPFFCNNLYTNRFGFSIQMQRFYFHKKRAKTNKDNLQILDIVENQCIRKCHVTVNVRQYYHINRSEKPVTRTAKTHTRERGWGFPRVRVQVGLGYPRVTHAIPYWAATSVVPAGTLTFSPLTPTSPLPPLLRLLTAVIKPISRTLQKLKLAPMMVLHDTVEKCGEADDLGSPSSALSAIRSPLILIPKGLGPLLITFCL